MPHHSKTKTTARREAELKAMLENRRRELVAAVNGHMRDVRERDAEREPVGDHEGPSFVGPQDLELALIQMKAEALRGIDAALGRLNEGRYGHCAECGDDIAKARLAALPFAVRCTDCEKRREASRKRSSLPARSPAARPLIDAAE
jgi:DnaK suppressor protein